jgi:hypothetical protein
MVDYYTTEIEDDNVDILKFSMKKWLLFYIRSGGSRNFEKGGAPPEIAKK